MPGSKLEETDKGKERLLAFTEKVKMRLCRAWASPAELGSAVKSAIFSELELTPQPGWIRADALPSWDSIEKMKQRIADLEEQVKEQGKIPKTSPTKKPSFPDGDQLVDIALTVEYHSKKVRVPQLFSNDNDEDEVTIGAQKKIETVLPLKWDDLILMLAAMLKSKSTLGEIRYSFDLKMREKVDEIVQAQLGNVEYRFTCSHKQIEIVLKTLMAKKLIRPWPVYGSYENPQWQFTPKGFQYLAGLEAIRSTEDNSQIRPASLPSQQILK